MGIKNLKSKKGNIALEIMTVLVFIFIFGIVTFFSYKLLYQVNNNIQNDDNFDSYAKSEINNYTTKSNTTLDNTIFIVFILLWIFVVISAFYIDTNPIFLVINLILLTLVFGFAAIMGNAYESIITAEEISTIVALFPKANYIATHYLQIALAIGFSIIISLFAKNQQ